LLTDVVCRNGARMRESGRRVAIVVQTLDAWEVVRPQMVQGINAAGGLEGDVL
jgi:hypothetical protein